MHAKKSLYFLAYSIIAVGMAISVYLLFHHFSLISGKAFTTDLCTVVFGKGCSNALYSNLSEFLHIPLGGWGMIYLAVLGCFVLFNQILAGPGEDDMIQIAFWWSLAGSLFSAFYLVIMLTNPILFCPFCTAFHILNFILFFLVKALTKLSYGDLAGGLKKGLGHLVLAKPLPDGFIKLKWLAYLFPLVFGLVIYQWARMEGLNIKNEKLASYDPLVDIQNYESRQIRDISLTPDDPLLGPADAPVTLVVFSDLQCSVCSMFAANFTDLIKTNQGKLNIRFKHFPLCSSCNPITKEDLHPMACKAARAAEAAGLQGKFWAYHDSIFTKNVGKEKPTILFDIARSIGLDMDRFKSDMESENCGNLIDNDIREGIRLGIDGTPTVYLNGRQVLDLRASSLNFLIKYLAH